MVKVLVPNTNFQLVTLLPILSISCSHHIFMFTLVCSVSMKTNQTIFRFVYFTSDPPKLHSSQPHTFHPPTSRTWALPQILPPNIVCLHPSIQLMGGGRVQANNVGWYIGGRRHWWEWICAGGGTLPNWKILCYCKFVLYISVLADPPKVNTLPKWNILCYCSLFCVLANKPSQSEVFYVIVAWSVYWPTDPPKVNTLPK